MSGEALAEVQPVPTARAVASRRRQLAVLLIAALFIGCSDALAPGDRNGDWPVLSAQASSRFISNNVKYRDSGARPVGARAGSAAANVLAVMNAAGEVEVHVQAESANPLSLATPVLSQVQLRGYGSDGRQRFLRNDNRNPGTNTASYIVGGLTRGDRVRVQANVRGADVWRVGVVNVDATVYFAPSLHIETLVAPATAIVQTPVNITALVLESNGDMGARANCVLLVDGVEVDRASNIWVDAGGAVSCAFAHVFTTTGLRTLEARLDGVQPGDFAAMSSGATTQIEIVDPEPPVNAPNSFAHEASFMDRVVSASMTMTVRSVSADGRSGSDRDYDEEERSRWQDSYVNGTLNRVISFPVTAITVQHSANGGTVLDARFADIPAAFFYSGAGWSQTCGEIFTELATGETSIFLCTGNVGGSELTTINHSLRAGEVTYRSRDHNRIWNLDTGQDEVYTVNNHTATLVGEFATPGTDYHIRVRLEDGSDVYEVNPVVVLTPFENVWSAPNSCSERNVDGWITTTCFESSTRRYGVQGYTSGS